MQPQPAQPPVWPPTNSHYVEEIIRQLQLLADTLDQLRDEPPVVEQIMEHLVSIYIMIEMIDHQ